MNQPTEKRILLNTASKLKLRKILLLLICIFLPTVTLFGQGSQNREYLIGTWELDYNLSIARIDPSSKTHYDTISQEVKTRIIDSFSQRKITFRSDGIYLLQVTENNQVEGTWTLQNDNKTLIIVTEGNEIQQEIESVDEQKMVLNLGGPAVQNRLFKKWYLNKISG